jgi:hypothetical protein
MDYRTPDTNYHGYPVRHRGGDTGSQGIREILTDKEEFELSENRLKEITKEIEGEVQ